MTDTAALNTALAGLTPYLAAGDTIDICLARRDATAGSSASIVPQVEIFSPLTDLFELQASVTLGAQFGVNFYATYASKIAADAATVSLTDTAGKALIPTTSDTNNADGTLTRRYKLTGVAAKELTDTIQYSFSCTEEGKTKTQSGTTSVATLLSAYLKKAEELVDTTARPPPWHW